MAKQNLKTILNFRKRTKLYALLALVGVALNWIPLFASQAQATVPKYINFQGKLTKVSDGTNVTNGSYAFEFKLYDASTSGTLLWTETYDQPSGACTKLVVTSGVFNAKLGSCASLSGIDFTGGSIYLSVNFAPTGVSYDGEMSPRKQLVATPFALVANSVSGDGPINTVSSSATALSVAKSGSNYGLQVDTSAGSAATGLKITSAAAASGIALSAISSGTNENITLDAKGTGSVSLGATSTGDILLGGGSGSTGCTVTNSTGAFACTAGGSFTTLALTGAVTGAASYNGLVITANTGVITTGTWNGTALTDAFVSDTLTSSLFVGSGSTTTAIDLATAEVAGILGAANGGTSNGFTAFTGPATSTKTFTLPNASATILTDNALVTVAQGGTGANTLTGLLLGNGTSAVTGVTTSAGVSGALSDETGSGALVFGTSPTLTTPRFVDLGYLADSSGNELLILDSNASAVNEITITNAATGNGVTIAATGGDAAVNISFDAKGTGTVNLGGTSTGNILLGGGSGSTGCTITNSTGALACTAAITGSNLSGTNTGDQTITLTGEVTGSGTGSFATTITSQTSATWAGKVSDETGSGAWVFANTPTLVTPIIGAATGTSIALTSTTATGDANGLTDNSFAPAASATGNLLNLTYTNVSANASGTSTTNGINLTPTVNVTSGAGIHNTTGLNLGTVTATACSAGTCNKYGIYAPSSNNYTDLFNYNGTSVINATGQVNAAQLTGTVPSGSISGSYTGITGVGTLTVGTWNGTAIGAQYGGTGINTSASTGVPSISSGTWSVNAQLPVNLGGTGAGTFTANGVLYGNGTSAIGITAAGTTGQCLNGNTSAAPTWGACGSGTVNSGVAGYFGYYPSTGTTIDDQTVLFTNGTNIGIGDATPAALLTVGSGDLFQVNSSGTLTFNGVTTDITTGTNEALTIAPNGTGSVIISSSVTSGSGSGSGLYATSSTVTSGTVITFSSTSTAAAGNTQQVLNVSNSGTNAASNQLTYGASISNTHGGTGAVNIALNLDAYNGAANYALYAGTGVSYFANNVGIGAVSPGSLLQIQQAADSTNSSAPVAFDVNSAGATGELTGTGTQTFARIAPVVNQTGAGGYTALLVNATETATGSAGKYLLDLQTGGASKFSVQSDGTVINASTIFGGGDIYASSSGVLGFASRSRISSPADSNLLLTNAAANAFNLLQFGGTSSSFPALKRSTTTLQARLADDSGYATIDAGNYLLSGTNINTAGTLTNVAYKNQVNTFTANNIFQPTVTTGTGATAGVQIAANSLTTGNGLDVSSTSLTTGNLAALSSSSTSGGASSTSTLLNLSRTGVNSNTAHTAYGLYSTVTNTNVTSGTNIAAYLSASGATTANYGLIVGAGNVGIGTTTPKGLLEIDGYAGQTILRDLGAAVDEGGWSFTTSATTFTLGSTNDANNAGSSLLVAKRGSGTTITSLYSPSTSTNFGLGDSTPASLLTVGNGDLFQVNSSGAIAAVVGITNTGAQSTTVSSTTALTVAKTGSNYALQVDTNTASAATGIKITSAAAAGGIALAAISSGTNENLTLDAKGSGTVSINDSATGDILFGGGSGSTGCTVTNSTGAFACTAGGSFTTLGLAGAITGATGITSSGTINFSTLSASSAVYTDGSKNLTSTAPTSGAIGYWSRSGSTLSTTTGGDAVTTSGNISTSSTGTITSAGTLTASNGLTLTTGALNLTGTSGSAAITGYGTTSITSTTATGNINTLANSSLAPAASATGYLLNLTLTNGSTNATGTSTVAGINIAPTTTAAGAGGTMETYGIRIQNAAGTAGAGTQNIYGMRIGNQGAGTNTETTYGLYVDTQTGGATASYAAVFAGGNVGIGTTTPTASLHVGSNGAASNPGLKLSGSWFTGGDSTTTKPQALIEASGATSSGWSTSGTGLGINAPSGFAGRMIDVKLNGTSAFALNEAGGISILGQGVTNIGAANAYWYQAGGTLSIGNNGDSGASNLLLRAGVSGSSGGNITFNVNNSNVGIWNGTGLGIGTGTPVDPLSISTAVNASATRASFNLSNTALSGGSSNGTYIGANPGAFTGNFFDFQVANSSVAKLTSGGALTVTSCTGCSSGVRLDQITAANTTATIANTNNAIAWNWGSLTTQTGMTFGGGTAMTTGSVFTIGNGTYNHANGETGSIAKILVTDGTTTAGAVTSTTNGLNIASTIAATTSTSGTKTVNAINVASPTLTSCTGGASCVWNGVQITAPATTASFTSTALKVVADSLTTDTVTSISAATLSTGNALSITAGGTTQLTSGAGLKVTGPSGAAAIANGLVQITAAGAYTGTGGLLNVLATTSTAGTLANFTNNTASFTGTGITASFTGTTTGNDIVISPGSGVTSGSALQINASGTSAIANGLLQVTHSGAYTSTGGLLNLTGNSTTAGVIASLSGTSLTTGNALNIAVGSGITSGSAINVTASGTSAIANGLLQVTHSGAFTSTGGLMNLVGNSSTAGTLATVSGTGITTGTILNVAAGAGITSGAALKVSASGTSAIANGLVQITHSGAYTSTGGLLNVTGNSTTTGTLAQFSATGLTTGTAIKATGGSAMTTGSVFTIGNGTYNHANGETGSIAKILVTDGTTTAGAVTSTTNGLNIASTIAATTSTSGTKTVNAINVASPTLTSCTGGASCVWNGVQITAPATTASFTSTALKVVADSLTTDTVTSISAATLSTGNALSITAGGTTQLTSGAGLKVTGPSGAAAIANGLVQITAAGAYTGTGGLLNVLATTSTAGTLANFTNNTASFTGTGITASFTGTTTGNDIVISPGSGVTSGSALQINASGTSAIANGLLQVTHSGAYTSTGGLLNLTGNSTTAGVIASLSGTSLTTGNALNIAVGSGITSGSAINVTASGTSAIANGLLQVTHSGAFTSTGGLMNLVGNSSTAGTLATVSGTGITTGTILNVAAGAGITSGAALKVSASGTSAIANGLVQITHSGAYTSTGGLLNVTGNSTTTGTLAQFSATGLTTGTAIKATGGSAMTTGSVLDLGSSQYVHTGSETGNALAITITDASSNASGTAITSGIQIQSSLSTTASAGGKQLNGIKLFGYFNSCGTTSGSCEYYGINQFIQNFTQSTTNSMIIAANTINGGALVQNTAAGGIQWYGTNLTMPNITQTTGSIVADGQKITTGSITTGGTVQGINIQAGNGAAAGTLNGVNISNITAGAGAETAIKIGSGWDTGVSITGTTGQTTQAAISTTGYSYLHTGTETGSLVNLSFTDASSNTTGIANTIGINITPTFNTTASAGSKLLQGIYVNPTITACGATGGSCTLSNIAASTPALTQTTTNNTSLKLLDLGSASSLVQNTAAGIINWTGVAIQMPNTTQTTGTVTSTGIAITGGTVTSGTAYALTTSATAGNVGIGTTTPAALLHVKQSSKDILFGYDSGCGSAVISFRTSIGSCDTYTLSDTGGGYTQLNSVNRLDFRMSNANKMSITSTGNVGIGTDTPLKLLDVIGSGRFKGTATSVLTGSIDPAASTSVTGVSTLFTTELVVGDRITVSGETRTVTAISSDTALTVDTAFSNNANDTSVDKLAAQLIVKDSSDNVNLIVQDNGKVGIGTSSPDTLTIVDASKNQNTFTILRVYNSNSGSNASARIALGNDSNAFGGQMIYSSSTETAFGGANSLNFYNGANAPIAFFTNGVNQRMTISGAGALRLHTYGAGTLVTDGSGNVTASSDIRLKDVQGSYNRGLSSIMEIEPILFRWNNISGLDQTFLNAGFSAQNIQAAIPEAVDTDPQGYLSLSDRPILAALVNATKELGKTSLIQDSQGVVSKPSFTFIAGENDGQSINQVGGGISESQDTSFIVNQKGSGNLLQLQKDGMDNFLIANDGTLHMDTHLASGTVLEVKNNNTVLFSIDYVGNTTLGATLVVKKDVAVLGRILGSTAVVAKNTSNEAIHQGDLLMLTGATAEPMLGDQPTLTIAKAVAGTNTIIVGIADRNLSDFNINPDSPVTDDPTTIKPGEYVSIVITGTYKKVFVNGSITLGDKLTASSIAGKAEKLAAEAPGQVFGISLDSTPDNTGSIRVMLLSTFQQVTQIVQQVPVAQNPSPAPSQEQTPPSSSDEQQEEGSNGNSAPAPEAPPASDQIPESITE